ncbi:MAG: hypothetical protein ACFFA8_01455 [Promethearchaeota archaeon]
MNELVFYNLTLLLLVRLIGLSLSIDLYFRSHNVKFITFIVGWTFWFLAGIFPIFSDITTNLLLDQIFLTSNGILASLGTIIIFLGIVYNFKFIKFKIFIILCIFILLFEIVLAIFINYRVSIGLSFIISEFSILSLILLHLAKGSEFIRYIGKSIIWYYITVIFGLMVIGNSIFLFLKGYSYGLYDSNDNLAIFFNYFFGTGVTILILIFFIHLEYNILKQQQLELKDIYSHDLGNILQSILSASEIMSYEKDDDLMNLIKEKSKEASELISKIKKLD